MPEKFFPIDRKAFVEIDSRLYVPESKVAGLVGKEAVLPVYFASSGEAEVIPDSPVMGAESFGPLLQDPTAGPFFSLAEAKKVLQERKRQVDGVHYEFSGKVVGRALPLKNGKLPSLSEIQVYRYHKQDYQLRSGHNQRFSYIVSNEQVKIFFQRTDKEIRQRAKESREAKDNGEAKLLAITDRNGICFIELGLKHGFEFDEFFLNSFSPEEHDDKGFYSELRNLGINTQALLYRHSETISLSPIEISLSYDSVEDIVRKNDLIS